MMDNDITADLDWLINKYKDGENNERAVAKIVCIVQMSLHLNNEWDLARFVEAWGHAEHEKIKDILG